MCMYAHTCHTRACKTSCTSRDRMVSNVYTYTCVVYTFIYIYMYMYMYRSQMLKPREACESRPFCHSACALFYIAQAKGGVRIQAVFATAGVYFLTLLVTTGGARIQASSATAGVFFLTLLKPKEACESRPCLPQRVCTCFKLPKPKQACESRPFLPQGVCILFDSVGARGGVRIQAVFATAAVPFFVAFRCIAA